MKKTKAINLVVAVLVAATSFTSCMNNSNNTANLQAKVDSLQNELKKFTDEKAMTEMRLTRFDSLDFQFYSNQDWKNFNISHADDIKVYYPDGMTTTRLKPPTH
jgi:hypothetical protein